MLNRLVAQLGHRIDTLSLEMASLPTTQFSTAQRRQAEHIAFQLQNVWELYIRNFILSSATGCATSPTYRLPPSVPKNYRNRESVSHYLLKQTKKRFEPKWYRPDQAIKAAQNLNIANFAKVAAAIGSTPWPLDDLRLIRNFFAHRSRDSALEIRKLDWFNSSDIIEVETTLFSYFNGVQRFNFWGKQMKLISRAML